MEVNTIDDLLTHFKAREKVLEDRRKDCAVKAVDVATDVDLAQATGEHLAFKAATRQVEILVEKLTVSA